MANITLLIIFCIIFIFLLIIWFILYKTEKASEYTYFVTPGNIIKEVKNIKLYLSDEDINLFIILADSYFKKNIYILKPDELFLRPQLFYYYYCVLVNEYINIKSELEIQLAHPLDNKKFLNYYKAYSSNINHVDLIEQLLVLIKSKGRLLTKSFFIVKPKDILELPAGASKPRHMKHANTKEELYKTPGSVPVRSKSLDLKQINNSSKHLKREVFHFNRFDSKKYDFLLSYNQTIKTTIEKQNYIDVVGLFLEQYKFRSVLFEQDFFLKFKLHCGENKIPYKNSFLFKERLKGLWKLGLVIITYFHNTIEYKDELEFFNSELDKLMNSCEAYMLKSKTLNKLTTHLYPFEFDWYLFCSLYCTVMCYKLYIDYKTIKTVNQKYITQILYYIPQLNYSKNIKRVNTGNVLVLSVNYIIAHIFLYREDSLQLDSFLNTVLNSEIYMSTVQLNFVKEGNGLYPDGGFVSHNNISYNYLMQCLYPLLFHELIFMNTGPSVSKILSSVFKIFYNKTKKVNPLIISRFGKFDEMYKTLKGFSFSVHLLSEHTDMFKDNYYVNKLNQMMIIQTEATQEPQIYIINSIKLISAMYKDWNIQLQVNCNLAYGEADIYNKQILKQLWLSKILLFKDVDINDYQNHSKYPGVLFYEKNKDESEILQIDKGVTIYSFEYVYYAFGKIDQLSAFTYNKIKNLEFGIQFEEFVLITPVGIVVCYLNIVNLQNEKLFLCYDSHIYKNKIQTGLLYNHNKNATPINEDNKYKFIETESHVIYYNLYIKSKIILNKLQITNDNTKEIQLTINEKVYHIYCNKDNNINISVTNNTYPYSKYTKEVFIKEKLY